jgi:hypothetical protein
MNDPAGSGVKGGRVGRSLIRLSFGVTVSAGLFAACSGSEDPNSRDPWSNPTGGSAASSSGGIGGGGTSSGPGGGINVTGGTGAGPADAASGSGGAGGSIGNPSPTPIVIDECPGPLDAGTVQSLQGGGASGARLLYPYDRTVFPVGLLPPLLQWQQSGTADAVYLHMKSALFEYKGCFGPNASFRLGVPNNAWASAGQQSGGATDPLTVELTVKSGGTILGPMTEQLIFALGKLKGDLFYNTYTSPQAANNGAVMKLRLGDTQPKVLLTDVGVAPLGPCWSCHSLSATGGVLVAQHHFYPGGPYYSSSFDLVANPTPQPAANVAPTSLTTLQSSTAEMGLGAVYPDGSKVLTMGSPGDSSLSPAFPAAPNNVPGMIGPKPTMLINVRTGAQIPISGWNVQYAQMPSFSPDGSLVVFNWHENSSGHSLAIAQFDTNNNSMSNVRVIYNHSTLYPGWPFITPDNKEVVFVLGNKADFVSGYPGRLDIAVSDLWTVDIATGQARTLARANGYSSPGGATYLPQAGRDEHLAFFPTMSPIAAGGYFWVFFTSRRTYGNTILQAANDAVTKKIWVSAFNIRTGDIIADPSNPPFYLPGQEDVAGNIRAFAALEPCHADGATCETGVDCCIGHCYNGTCQLPPPPPPPDDGAPPPPPCSNIDERCTQSSDCCDPRATCVGGYCTFVVPR